jgi:carbohydrate-binding DOMON domain-containing protein
VRRRLEAVVAAGAAAHDGHNGKGTLPPPAMHMTATAKATTGTTGTGTSEEEGKGLVAGLVANAVANAAVGLNKFNPLVP